MKKKKIIVCCILTIFVIQSLYKPIVNQSAQIIVPVGVVLLAGTIYLGCDYLYNPGKYADLIESMKDFKNTTVENQKKLYEMEKANYEMVMKKAVDANVGTCLIGSNGTLYSAKQLQSQEYPSFDTWKGYKEKESHKPKPSLWDLYELGSGLADLICTLWPDCDGFISGGIGEQLYYTGDDGYIDRESGVVTITYNSKCLGCYYDPYYISNNRELINMYTDNFHTYSSFKVSDPASYKLAMFVHPVNDNYLYYHDDFGRVQKTLYRAHANVSSIFYDPKYMLDLKFSAQTFLYGDKDNLTGAMFSCQYSDGKYQLRLFDFLSTNIPVFDSREHMEAYFNNGSLEGLINGVSDAGSTPTDAPHSDSHIGPVRQYTNYFRNTFSPSLMANYVNYNIVNNWDGDTSTFNINNYTGKESDDSEVTATPTPDLRKPTFTPIPPNTDGGDTNNYDVNITNNLIIEQTNIIQEINQTLNNIYNFFQIDVDVIVEDLTPDTDSKFLPLYDLVTDINKLIPGDEFEVIEGQAEPIISTLYPKVTIKVPLVLDDFLSISDEKIMEKDGDKVIIMCDFYDYRIYFARFRKFLEVVIYIGMFFYLMKEFSVIWSIQ